MLPEMSGSSPAIPPVHSEEGEGRNHEVQKELKDLTPAARKFSELYALNNNISKSSILAGCHADYGHSLLRLPAVQQAVAYFRAVHLDKALYTETKLMRQWAQMASIDLTEYIDDDYALKPLSQLTDEQRQHLGMALVGLEVTEKAGKRFVKPKLAKVEALENLGKLLHLYAEDKSQGEGLTLNITLGQQVNVGQSEGSSEDVGPFRVVMPGMAQEEG